jgi:steroid 5-alpha reductase family enzyme
MSGIWVLGGVLVIMGAVMSAAFLYQRAAGNSGWIDVFWTFGTGLAGAMAALLPYEGAGRQWLVAAIVVLWSARLGGYIAQRVAGAEHEDARYRHFRKVWGADYQKKLFAFVMPQAAVSALLCISIYVAAHRNQPGLDVRDALGVAILMIAIGGESLADAQLSRFKRTNTGQGAINDRGLWAWSRHPNYFFEWFGWLAYPVIGLQFDRPLTWATLIAPVIMYLVLRFATGVKPTEETMLASRGEAFRAYQRRTSAFFPLPPKRGAST